MDDDDGDDGGGIVSYRRWVCVAYVIGLFSLALFLLSSLAFGFDDIGLLFGLRDALCCRCCCLAGLSLFLLACAVIAMSFCHFAFSLFVCLPLANVSFLVIFSFLFICMTLEFSPIYSVLLSLSML